MPETEKKQKAKRNRTIDCTVEEGKELLKRCVSVEKDIPFTEIENRIILGNTFEVAPHLPKGFVDLLVVDPPYNLSKEFHGEKFSRRSVGDYREYTRRWIALVKPLLKPNASIYVCCDWRSSGIVGEVLGEHFYVQNRITWQREKGRGAKSNWKNSMEDIWFATCSRQYPFYLDAVMVRKRVVAPYRVDGKPKDWEETEAGNFRNTCPSNFWDDISVPYWSMPENTAHPTQKPEKLIAKLILASSSEGDVVFDPFAGSGTTAVTAKKLGRRFVAIEQSDLYCVWAQRRLEMAEENPSIQGYSDGVFWERNTAALQKQLREQKQEEDAPKDAPSAPGYGEASSGYHTALIDRLVQAIQREDGIGDKEKLAGLIQQEFSLEKKGSVYLCGHFAIRFCKAQKHSISNTVLAFAKLLELDSRPFFVCGVASDHNFLLLANTTLLCKISHSSRDLRVGHIRGNFNGTDILRQLDGLPNTPEHFSELFALHCKIPTGQNILRLVDATSRISGRGKRFEPDEQQRFLILDAARRAKAFCSAGYLSVLQAELDARVEAVREEIALAAKVGNVNLRGRIIETLITGQDEALRAKISESLRHGTPLPAIRTADALGDLTRECGGFHLSIDIKSKALFKNSNPKGYNVDKLLRFLSEEGSVYLVYLVGFDEEGTVTTRLCSILQDGFLDATGSVIHHWAGRNSRGVVQLNGHALAALFAEPGERFDGQRAGLFLQALLDPQQPGQEEPADS